MIDSKKSSSHSLGMTSARKTNPPIFIEAILLFAWVLFQNRPRLLSSSMNYDEILAWEWESGTWLQLFTGVLNDTQQVLYYALVKINLYFTSSNNDYWARFPSLVLGSSATLGIYYYIRKNYSMPTAAFFVGSVVLHPLIAYVATYNRPYSLFLFLMCWHLVLCHKVLIKRESENNWLQWGLVISTAALPFVHYLALIYLLSVLIGVLLTVGPESLVRVYSSIGRLLFSAVAGIVLAICFSYQIQFNERISWVFDSQYDYFYAVKMAVGFGGVFLFFFFYKIKTFSSRDLTEKFLAISFVVALLLMTLSKLWIGQYFLALTPLSLWLSSLYFEKVLQSFREIQLLRKYVAVVILAIFLFINPYFTKGVNLENRLFTVADIFFRSFRTGDLEGLKHFFIRLKEKNVITNESKILCVKGDAISERPAEQYSKMYWQRDICSKYVISVREIPDIATYDYILLFRFDPTELSSEFGEILQAVDDNLSSVVTATGYELYQVNLNQVEGSI